LLLQNFLTIQIVISTVLISTATLNQVIQNEDLMLLISSFLLISNKDRPLILSSPVLPLVLSFRALHTIMRRALSTNCDLFIKSVVRDFATSVDLVQWTAQMGLAINETNATMLLLEAAANGKLDVVKWLINLDPGLLWLSDTCRLAAENGHLHVLQWIRAQDPLCPWDKDICTSAARNGHLHVLQWVRAQDPPCPWDGTTCSWAAEHGHLHVLQWVRAQDPPCPWNYNTCSWAAWNGHLDVIQWARAQDPPCPWNKTACCNAAGNNGHWHVIRWVHSHWDDAPT
jgi:hypothetical protein